MLPTVMFFWDYDTQWGVSPPRGPKRSQKWGFLEFENAERLLELHCKYEIPACFAVVGAAALRGTRPYHDPRQIRQIHEAGHEIASHSMYHEWLPGLNRRALLRTLHASKDALEQCIGAAIRSFVPPYDQPYDYARGWSFSLAERREACGERTDLYGLCDALRVTGYQFCRVAYRPIHQRFTEWLTGRQLNAPSTTERIAGVACVRVNAPTGFRVETVDIVSRCANKGGIVVIRGHPHSLRAGNSQDESWLLPLFERIRCLRRKGAIRIGLPRDLVTGR